MLGLDTGIGMGGSLHIFPMFCEEVTKDGVSDFCDNWHHNRWCVKMPWDTYKEVGERSK